MLRLKSAETEAEVGAANFKISFYFANTCFEIILLNNYSSISQPTVVIFKETSSERLVPAAGADCS